MDSLLTKDNAKRDYQQPLSVELSLPLQDILCESFIDVPSAGIDQFEDGGEYIVSY